MNKLLQVSEPRPQVSEQPSSLGRGCPATALSPAVAGRVRGLLHGEEAPDRSCVEPFFWTRKGLGNLHPRGGTVKRHDTSKSTHKRGGEAPKKPCHRALSEDEALDRICDCRSGKHTYPIEKLFKKFNLDS